jgi:maltooligosyltrehalose trehalohydrolase
MGVEYGESAPFQFFTSHGDPDLADAVRRGRVEEFNADRWASEIPNPQATETFNRSKLNPEHRDSPRGRALQAFHRELIRLRRTLPALAAPSFTDQDVELAGTDGRVILIRRRNNEHEALVLLNFADETAQVRLPAIDTSWTVILDSSEARWSAGQSSEIDRRPAATGSIEVPPWSAMLLNRTIDGTVAVK